MVAVGNPLRDMTAGTGAEVSGVQHAATSRAGDEIAAAITDLRIARDLTRSRMVKELPLAAWNPRFLGPFCDSVIPDP